MMGFNDVVSAILKSPLHGLISSTTMLITVTGRRSGKFITTPVTYVRSGETLLITSRTNRTWWCNLIGGAPIRVVLQGRERVATGRAFSDNAAVVTRHLQRIFAEKPSWAGQFGIHRDANGGLNAEDLNRAGHELVAVEVMLSG